MATLTHAELETLWVLNGGLQQDADTAAAIAEAESGGCQYAKAGPTDDRPVKECVYRPTTLENSYGLWQVNRQAHSQYSAATLYTLNGNATAAADIQRARGNFSDWTTFTNGTYKQHLTGTVSVTPQPGATFTVSPADVATHSLRGWNDFNRALAMHLPTNLGRCKVLTKAASRRLAEAGRR